MQKCTQTVTLASASSNPFNAKLFARLNGTIDEIGYSTFPAVNFRQNALNRASVAFPRPKKNSHNKGKLSPHISACIKSYKNINTLPRELLWHSLERLFTQKCVRETRKMFLKIGKKGN